ncbi:MAG: hypothetical protein C5B45_02860 [Chlamydiae bacterium]|nr:MAG: hypothetical protein C5B45_02860 [Chlamydiota bacterium]
MTSLLQSATSAIQKEMVFNSHCRNMAKDNALLACNYVKSTFTGILAHPVPTIRQTNPIGLKDRCVHLIKAPLLLLRSPLLYLPLINRVTQLALRFLSPEYFNFRSSSPFRYVKSTELKIRYNENALNAAHAKLLLLINTREGNEFNPSTFTNKGLLDAYIKLSPPLSIAFINSPEFKEDQVKARYSKDTRCKFVENYFQDEIAKKEKIANSTCFATFLDLLQDEQALMKLGFTQQECYDIFLNVSAPHRSELEKLSSLF